MFLNNYKDGRNSKIRSIVYKLTAFATAVIILQTFFFTASLVIGGVLKESKSNALNSFDEMVKSRKSYLERDMKNRWTNLGPFAEQISEKVSGEHDSSEALLSDVSLILVDMLRSTQATGAYLILKDETESGRKPALYLRDYDPLSNNYSNDDIYTVIGPSEISGSLKIPLDQTWKYDYEETDQNRDFFFRPYSKAHLSKNAGLLGYWSTPFRLSPDDLEIITYSMPLFDKDKNLRGIIGIEITLNYFVQLLPATDLQPKDSLGYMVAYRNDETKELNPVISIGALQKRIIDVESVLQFEEVDKYKDIFILKNHDYKKDVYASVNKIGLYPNNTPFESEEWYLIGFIKEDYLFKYYNSIQGIIIFSFVSSLILGILGSLYFSMRFSKPIVSLADKVRISEGNKKLNLDSTGLREVDELAEAMESAKDKMIKSASRLTRIISMLDVPIAAFEIGISDNEVFVTDNFYSIMDMPQNDISSKIEKDDFQLMLDSVFTCEYPDEKGIYKIRGNPQKWIKLSISKNEDTVIGIIQDVTNEMTEKIKIQNERDLDPLTKLYNRRAFQNIIEQKHRDGNLKVAALMMFDLDNLKLINDSYGHKWGDIYIVESVSRLRMLAGNENLILGRRSGDEFEAFLSGYSSREEIINDIEEFYQYLDKTPLEFPGGDIRRICMSGGLVWIEERELDYDDMMHMADNALYKAKTFNKGSYEVINMKV